MPTYSGDPTASQRDALRFLIDDTDVANPMFEDGELDAVLRSRGLDPEATGDIGAVRGAAVEALEIVARRMALQPSFQIGRFSEDRSKAAQIIADRIKELKASLSGGLLYAGGISKADKEAQEADTDRVQPAFRVGLHDSPEAKRGTVRGVE